MPKYNYREHLHEEWEEGSEFISDWLNRTGQPSMPEEEYETINHRPFYEVTVDCILDTDAGTVTATHFQGVPLTQPVQL